MDRATKMGPVVSQEQMERVMRYQEIGKKEAKVGGGRRPRHGRAGFEKGYFVQPTIFYDVDNSATIAREEIFGPVMSVIPFDDEAEALKIANDTPYGLAAAVWSRDIFKCFRMVQAPPGRHRLGEPHAAHLRGSALGRLQDDAASAASSVPGAPRSTCRSSRSTST